MIFGKDERITTDSLADGKGSCMVFRKRKNIALLLAAVLFAGTLSGCGGLDQKTNQTADRPEDGAQGQEAFAPSFGGSFFHAEQGASEDIGVVPCVAPYTVASDLGNVDNLWQFYLDDGEKEKLARNGFVVFGEAGREFFEIYERNRYVPVASFVTVDSLMHTYHLYFSYLLKRVEKDYLADCLTQLSARMLDASVGQYESLKGTEWEEAAKRNVAFFTVGTKLLDGQTPINAYVEEPAAYELEQIDAAQGIGQSKITGGMEDYTQYKPRGYYEGDEELERYFRAMMWYGRTHFKQAEEELDRSALLISWALSEDETAYGMWGSIYEITAFFSGASDDAGVYEYVPLLREIYGDGAAVEAIVGDGEAFERFHSMTAQLGSPQINSIPIGDGEDNVIPGFRFMGQRFSVDAAIMQKLVYSSVQENAEGGRRMLPDVLDVPAALGSDVALGILEEEGASDYAGYGGHMEQLRDVLARDNTRLWSASLYAGWLNTLRPLLKVKGEGYPMFMQSEEWAKKDLECFAGSYTELKHDTVLYTKQVIAEMGDAYDESADDRGYVQPEPLVYLRFKNLSDLTAQGLKRYGMLSAQEEENLSRLSEIAGRLLEISKKELSDESLMEEEYEFIRSYGGSIEHFWQETVRDVTGSEEWVSTQEAPAALVVDIATDPNGEVLEAATDCPAHIYVIVKVDGKIKIASGSVYSFYQFRWPMEDRLTDTKWHYMIGIKSDEEGNFQFEKPVAQPSWTESYRY